MIITKGTIFTDEVSDYEVLEQIGKGGFGAVWLAQCKKDGYKYAIKTLLSDFRDENELNTLANEIKMATQVSSPNVIRYIYTHDGSKFSELPPYIIMEYAENGSLSKLLEARKKAKQPFSNDELVKMFLQLANGMTEINTKLVHRDIKLDNILISGDFLKITDFGLCKLASEQTRTMSFKGWGTYAYMSPEAWDYTKNTKQMDIYSMGIVFYELATFSYPYDISYGKDCIREYQSAHTYDIPKPISTFNKNISPAQSDIIMKMLEKRTDKRYREWNEIITALSNIDAKCTSDSNIIDNMLSIQVARNNAKKAEESKNKKRMDEIKEFCKRVTYQYVNDIVTPLTTLINDFNLKSQSDKISLHHKGDNETTINLPSGSKITLHIQPLLEEDFVRQHQVDDFGRVVRSNYYSSSPYQVRTIERVEIPHYEKDRILAWGSISTDRGQGYNILLLKQEDDLYGKWLFIANTNSGFSNKQRTPEPFAFRLSELEKEVPLMKSTHIYNSQAIPFDEKGLFKFILNCF